MLVMAKLELYDFDTMRFFKLGIIMIATIMGCTTVEKPSGIDSFLGVKFGASKESTIEIMKPKCVFPLTQFKKDVIHFTLITEVAGRSCSSVWFAFHYNQMFIAQAQFYREEDKIWDLVHGFEKDLTELYGAEISKGTLEAYLEPATLPRIKTGDSNYITTWSAKMSDGKSNTVELEIQKDLSVTLTYTDKHLKDAYEARENKRQLQDL